MKTYYKNKRTVDWHINSLKVMDLLFKSLASEYSIDKSSPIFNKFADDLKSTIKNVCDTYSPNE